MLSLVATLVLATPRSSVDLTVLAAASLKAPLTEIATIFESRNKGVVVRSSFAGSQELAAQINLGAPADLFFSADQTQMDVVSKSGKVLASTVKPFASNQLCLIVAKGSASRIRSFSDIGQSGLKLCLAAEKVPIGAYTRQVFQNATKKLGSQWLEKVQQNTVSFESNVSSVVTRVELGEADAGIVYDTDALRAKSSIRIGIPKAWNVRALYYVGVVSDAPNAEKARQMVDLVLSREGQAILKNYGFLPPK